jgi:hypothetical protein
MDFQFMQEYHRDGNDIHIPPDEKLKFDNIQPKDVKLVFECEDCGKKQTDDVSNVTYNGAPMCCDEEMTLSHVEVKG